jgi:hypothetical protein
LGIGLEQGAEAFAGGFWHHRVQAAGAVALGHDRQARLGGGLFFEAVDGFGVLGLGEVGCHGVQDPPGEAAQAGGAVAGGQVTQIHLRHDHNLVCHVVRQVGGGRPGCG